jgi:hypothetical protein
MCLGILLPSRTGSVNPLAWCAAAGAAAVKPALGHHCCYRIAYHFELQEPVCFASGGQGGAGIHLRRGAPRLEY